MNVLIAPDKFKGSLSAQKVAAAIAKGILQQCPNAAIIQRPMADGGDGSLAVLEHYFEVKDVTLTVANPLNKPIKATYKIADSTAYIEMAAASGLALLHPDERNARKTTSLGTGQLIQDALEKGATQIYLFIGGSATNDGGMGIAQAIGYRFLDKNQRELRPIGENLNYIHRIDDCQVPYDFSKIAVNVICDVDNPFFGKNGAAYVYAPQKGATIEDVKYLDTGLQNLAHKLQKQGFPDLQHIAGAGAAGGVGGGAVAFLQAQLVSGISMFLTITALEKAIQNCDLVITGEGKLDAQTLQGKVISGVTALAHKYKKPIIAVCGAAEEKIAQSMGLTNVFTVMEQSASRTEAMTLTEQKLIQIGKQIAKS